MMQEALLFYRPFQICPPCLQSHFLSLLPPPPSVLLLLDLTFIPLKRLSGPPDRLLFCIIIFLPLFCYFHSILHSALTFCALALGILKVQCVFFFFFICFVHVPSHCFYNAQGSASFFVSLTLSHWRHCLETAM